MNDKDYSYVYIAGLAFEIETARLEAFYEAAKKAREAGIALTIFVYTDGNTAGYIELGPGDSFAGLPVLVGRESAGLIGRFADDD